MSRWGSAGPFYQELDRRCAQAQLERLTERPIPGYPDAGEDRDTKPQNRSDLEQSGGCGEGSL